MNINFSEREIEFFVECIKGKSRYVEYGSGKTTEIARIYCDHVLSIETDKRWADKLDTVHVDMGETRDWGYPVASPTIEMLQAYFSFAKNYDILLIDGRYRVGCAYHAEPGLFLVHDYNRVEYHCIETFATKIDQCETLTLFEKKPHEIINVMSAR
jgi:hypothetical protein